MDPFQEKLIEFLRDGDFISNDTLDALIQEAQKRSVSVEELIQDQGIFKEKEWGQLVANLNDWHFVDLDKEAVDDELLQRVPESVSRGRFLVPFSRQGDTVKVAMQNPDDTTMIHLLEKRFGSRVAPYYATREALKSALAHYRSDMDTEIKQLIQQHSTESMQELNENSAVVKMVDLILEHAYFRRASDVHVEPFKTHSVIRFRLDGVLHDMASLPRDIHDLIITRIKVLSRLRTDEHQVPQDGKMTFSFQDESVDIRVSIMPTVKGENVIMRLLSQKSRSYSIDDLGLTDENREKLQSNAERPWGMILVTGPTGSGKTTSLYAVMRILNRREVHLATIEDPVEYDMEGATQIQVNPKAELTFASGLRSIVRQDPDVIMVGEIRDVETAEIAVNSAMTGHLVLSTLHTNDAPSALPRLLEMDIEPFLVASTVNLVVAQRLLRRVCRKCVFSYEVVVNELEKQLPKEVVARLSRGRNGVRLFRGKGCEACKQTGYNGRIGVFEFLEMTDSIRESVMSGADAGSIRQKAIQSGMKTMFEDAQDKVLEGITTVEELLRVIKL